MSKRLTTLLAAALAIALIGLGCGGGSDGTTTAQISKAAFIKRADATCAKIYEQVEAGFQAFVKGKAKPFSNPREIRNFAETVLIPAKQQEVQELHGLGAPSGDEDKVGAILDAYEEGIETAEEDPRAAVSSAQGVFVKATELAEEYGLENCRY